MFKNKRLYVVLISSLLSFTTFAKNKVSSQKVQWVDSIYQSLTLEEKIGQLFMVAAYSGGPNANYSSIKPLVEQGKVGGLIYMQGNVETQIQQTNELQQNSKVPILISMDAEWGLGMRLTGVRDYPKQIMMGATRNSRLMEEMGYSIGKQLKNIGVHINFAPVVDINNNPLNPIINFRSFGEDKELVSELGLAYMKGLEKAGVMAVAKHFPGHGDVSVDSHYDLPVVKKSIEELLSFELYPFIKLIGQGLNGVLIAHLNVPAMDNRPNVPSTLSYPIITEWLRNKLAFKGLIFTDALNMKGVTKYYGAGEVDLNAFLAGNDVLLFSQNVEKGIQLIKEAYEDGRVSEQRLASSVRRILATKYDHQLHLFKPIPTEKGTENANKEVNHYWQKVSEMSLTLLRGKAIDQKVVGNKILHIIVNQTHNYNLSELWNTKNMDVTTIYIDKNASSRLNNLNINNFDQVVITLHSHQNYPGKSKLYGLSSSDLAAIQIFKNNPKVYVGILGNPYLANQVCGFSNVILGYESNEYSMNNVIKGIMGELPFQGKSPVSVCQ